MAIWISKAFGKTIHPDSVGRILRRTGMSRQKARPVHPKTNAKAQERFQKKGLSEALTAAAQAKPGKRIRLFFQDEARVGQKGRTCHRWWVKGQRPPGVCDQRFDWTYIFATVKPATGAEFSLVLPTVSTVTMNLFLAEFAKTLAPDDHVVVVLDGAGWHASAALAIPDTITLVPLPPYSPERNPVERIWLYLRQRFLSLQLWPDRVAIIQACCDAWNALAADASRIKSLSCYPWIEKVTS